MNLWSDKWKWVWKRQSKTTLILDGYPLVKSFSDPAVQTDSPDITNAHCWCLKECLRSYFTGLPTFLKTHRVTLWSPFLQRTQHASGRQPETWRYVCAAVCCGFPEFFLTRQSVHKSLYNWIILFQKQSLQNIFCIISIVLCVVLIQIFTLCYTIYNNKRWEMSSSIKRPVSGLCRGQQQTGQC